MLSLCSAVAPLCDRITRREALQEREVLLRLAPHIIRPLLFVLPHDKSMRPVWMIRIGLWMYDHIGGKISLPGSKAVRFPHMEFSAGLDPAYRSGFVYSDCRVDDSRLTVVNAMSAREKGATIAKDEPHAINAAYSLDRFNRGILIDEKGQGSTPRLH